MKVAVIGTGISGLVAAHKLYSQHDVDIYESADYVGGHTNTIAIEHAGQSYNIDTGFIVFNDWTYPNFINLLNQLGVDSQASDMGFSVSSAASNLEYSGNSINTLFAQRKNLLSPLFYRMLLDIARFNKTATQILDQHNTQLTLGDYLAQCRYSKYFINHYIIPMGAAIWSTDPQLMLNFPALLFVRFFKNHGLLNITNRPTWHVIKGGSKKYVEALIKPFAKQIQLNTAIKSISRHKDHVELTTQHGHKQQYDKIFIATHSDQALNMLTDPSAQEKDILGNILYQKNEAVLHTDSSLLPRNQRAWAAWNYLIPANMQDKVILTYNMNILQNINAQDQFCVTLNNTAAIAPDKIIRKINYHHPLYTESTLAAQQRWPEINGINHTFYCGAYWGSGFHEDGVNSALGAVKVFEDQQSHDKLHIQGANTASPTHLN